jgi:molybdopterin-guanine dinucleotide biosynthesis protein A
MPEKAVYYHPVSDLAAFVLAGGKSTRMGRDKAFVEFDGKTLLLRALELVSAVAQEVGIVGDREKFSSFGPVIEDVYPERGPLGGIHAALASSKAEFNLMLAVDLPFVEPRFLDYLIAQASECKATVTVPRAGGGWQPLCAVYRREFAAVAERALIAGNHKIDLLFPTVEIRAIDEIELSKLGFSGSMFRNLNTPEELENARRIHR